MSGEFLADVSVVLPTFQERETILDVVDQALGELEGDGYDTEIVVVDDDSPDGTGRLVRDEYEGDDRVDVLIRKTDQGLASAVLDGLRVSLGRFAVVMDADGQHPPDRLPALVRRLEGGERKDDFSREKYTLDPADVVVGSRHVAGGSIEGWPWSRKVVSAVASSIAAASVPSARRLEDPMSGFFGVDRDVVDDRVLSACDPHGYKILLEILAHADDPDVGEIPITFRDRQGGRSKMTVDEIVRFGEHVAGLGLVERDLDGRVYPPLLVRSLEFGGITGLALVVLFVGLIVGDVDGAAGAAMIAVSGGAFVLGSLRLMRTGEQWGTTAEKYAKGGDQA